jgi:hypothetical protein
MRPDWAEWLRRADDAKLARAYARAQQIATGKGVARYLDPLREAAKLAAIEAEMQRRKVE